MLKKIFISLCLSFFFFSLCRVIKLIRQANISDRSVSLQVPYTPLVSSQPAFQKLQSIPHIGRRLSSIFDKFRNRELQRFRRPGHRVVDEFVDYSQDENFNEVPKNALGFPCLDNPQVLEMGVDCKIISKTHLGFGCDKKIEDLVRERRRDLDRIPQLFRSARVADACPETCHLCTLCAPGCAHWFVGNSYCEQQCNNSPCKYDEGDCWDTNCVVGDWGEWSNCSISCDPDPENGIGGTQTRYREIVRKKTLNGKPCPNLVEHKTGCNKGVPCPIPCEVSKWGEWSSCSSSCGLGQSIRTRAVLQSPKNGAEKCPELTQTRSCYISECQQDCVISDWDPWSPCSNHCGEGFRDRKRYIVNPPIGNKTCPPLIETEKCRGTSCFALIQRVCKLSEYGIWSPCSVECNGGIQTRKRQFIYSEERREEELKPYGASCPPYPLVQTQECNTFPCDQDCKMSEWGEWSECSAECGEGYSQRRRFEVEQAKGAGISCPRPEENVQTKPCFIMPCSQDCEVSEWTPWSDCHVKKACGKGFISRSRTVTNHSSGHGAKCPHLEEFEPCIIPCEPQCVLGAMTSWSPCEDQCQSATAIEEKTVLSFRWNRIDIWARDCSNQLIESKKCGNYTDICEEPRPEDCSVSKWGPWSACSKSCGKGVRRRKRSIVVPPTLSGKPCPPLIEEELCGIKDCPVDCVTTEWSAWSSCSVECGIGYQIRKKEIITPASSNPAGLCDETLQRRTCIGRLGLCEVAHATSCQMSSWSQWSECSAPCGDYGWQYRTRHVLSSPNRQLFCPPLVDFQSCNQIPCDQECLLSEWSDWSLCSIDCGPIGSGTQRRTRQIIRPSSPNLPPCSDNLVEERICLNLKPCPIPCILSEWMPWSKCSKECGIGEVTRIREVLQQPAYGGLSCEKLTDTASCFIKPCMMDCEMSEWEAWSECSDKCGGGTRQRTRTVKVKPSNGGTPCGPLVEYEECNTLPCSEYKSITESECKVSPWSEWSACPVTCGGGVQTRSRTILQHGMPGSFCPVLLERRGCGLSHCKSEAMCKDKIEFLEAFDVTCRILLAQGCDHNLKELATSQGLSYPLEFPPEARVMDVCPLTCDVCKECAPGCQLRDKGNTVCDPECNNKACEFDLGDCGKDCTLPSPVPKSLRLSPAATGIDIGEQVEITCRDKGERFIPVPEYSRIILRCSDASEFTTSTLNDALLYVDMDKSSNFIHANVPSHVLKVFPEEAHYAFFRSPFVLEQLSTKQLNDTVNKGGSAFGAVFRCEADPCAFLHIQGFDIKNIVSPPVNSDELEKLDSSLSLLNGLYDRYDVNSGLPVYRQSNMQIKSPITPYFFYSKISDEQLNDVIKDGIGNGLDSISDERKNVKQAHKVPMTFTWRIEKNVFGSKSLKTELHDEQNYNEVAEIEIQQAFASANCSRIRLGEHIKYSECPGSAWTIKTPTNTLLLSGITVACLDKKERKTVLNKMKSMPKRQKYIQKKVETPPKTPHNQLVSVYENRPVTYNIFINKTHPQMMFCEDRPEVEQFAKRSCDELENTVSCDFKLSDAGLELPVMLPENALLSAVCPETCQLCIECAPNCPLWFLGNGYCDPACDVAECRFDGGDCKKNQELIINYPSSNETSSEGIVVCVRNDSISPFLMNDGSKKSCFDLFQILKNARRPYTRDKFCSMNMKELKSVSNINGLSDDFVQKPSGNWSTSESYVYEYVESDHKIEGFSGLPKQSTDESIFIQNVCHTECHKACSEILNESPNGNVKEIESDNTLTETSNKKSIYFSNLQKDEIQLKPRQVEGECVDDIEVKKMNLTCGLLKAVANRRFSEGCDVKILDLMLQQNFTMPLNSVFTKILPLLKLVDICPKTCDCCGCARFRRPKIPENGIWTVNSTLKLGEHPNCVHDKRIEEIASLSCFEIVDALQGNCSIRLKEISTNHTSINFPDETKLEDACGVACGKCPVCKDSSLVEEMSGFTCSQIVEIYDNNCDIFLREIYDGIKNMSIMAQLKHACPKTCGMCDLPHAYAFSSYSQISDSSLSPTVSHYDSQYANTNDCHDYSNISPGVTCEALFQYSYQNCQKPLKSMGVETQKLSGDLHPLSLIADACPKTCGICQTSSISNGKPRCFDNPMVQKMNQSCSTIIRVGNRGCATRLADLNSGQLPHPLPKKFKVKDICRKSCGLCEEASCTDGFQNGDEEGVDCGGSCRPCRSCSPAQLKLLISSYTLEGFGVFHGANRTLRCQKGYVREAGLEGSTIYCEDGSFTKPQLVCGTPKRKVFRSIVEINTPFLYNVSSLPELIQDLYLIMNETNTKYMKYNTEYESRETLSKDVDLRFIAAGDCSELQNMKTFVCENNVLVQQSGYDCSLLSRLGCSKKLSDLAQEHNVQLPATIPGYLIVGDACPVACHSCETLKKKMMKLKKTQKDPNEFIDVSLDSNLNSNDNCFSMEYVFEYSTSSENASEKTIPLNIDDDFRRKLSKAFERRLREKHHTKKISVFHDTIEEIQLPTAQWKSLYRAMPPSHVYSTNENLDYNIVNDATKIYISPGIPRPSTTSIVLPQGFNTSTIVGQMYRPIIGVGEDPIPHFAKNNGPDTDFLGKNGGKITGWYDASGAAAVISQHVADISDICKRQFMIKGDKDDQKTCCRLRTDFEQYFHGECGNRIYERVLSEKDLQRFCYKRDQDVFEPMLNATHALSCYEVALRLLEDYRKRIDKSCAIIYFIEKLINTWCSKNGIPESILSSEESREENNFCFPSLKTTLQKHFDLFYAYSISDEEMNAICHPHSCTRHHLRYIDALTQVQLIWILSISRVSLSFPEKSKNNDSHSNYTMANGNSYPGLTGFSDSFIDREQENTFEYGHRQRRMLLDLRHELKRRVSFNSAKLHRRKRYLQMSETKFPIGSFVGDFPELFLDFLCFQVKGMFCQQTLLLLVDEDLIHNPTTLREPCATACFVPMAGYLGGLLQSFGERQRHPYYEALGSLLRSYGRFFCNVNAKGDTCGPLFFHGSTGYNISMFDASQDIKAFSVDVPANLTISKFNKCSKSFVNDGQCDPECFTNETFWDGNDCLVSTMFPESFHALQRIFASLNDTHGTDEENMYSCNFYENLFSCTTKCRNLIKKKLDKHGCCFTAALKALGGLLRVEMKHPLVNEAKIWMAEKSISFLEQSCQSLIDITCSSEDLRETALRLDILFTNTIFHSIQTGAPIDLESTDTKPLIRMLQTTLAQYLQLDDSDIIQITFRSFEKHSVWSEIIINAPDELTRIKDWFDSEHKKSLLRQLLERRILSIPIKRSISKSTNGSYPSIVLGLPYTKPLFIIKLNSQSRKFDTKLSIPPRGTLGLPNLNYHMLKKVACSRQFEEHGQGYRITPPDSLDVQHGAKRDLRCFKDYYPELGKPLVDTLVCDSGRWIKKNGLTCYRQCSIKRLLEGHKIEAYKIFYDKMDSEWVRHGTSVTIFCESSHSASQGFAKTTITCEDGEWSHNPIVCKKNCNPYVSPDPQDGYVFEHENDKKLHHGTVITVSCAPGFFTFSLKGNNAKNATTQCYDGRWTALDIRCVIPQKIVVPKSPTLISQLFHQLFTGPGMIGILVAFGFLVVLIVIVSIFWVGYFKRIARENVEIEDILTKTASPSTPRCHSFDLSNKDDSLSMSFFSSQKSINSFDGNKNRSISYKKKIG